MDGTLSTNKKEATYKKIIFFQKDQKYQIEDYLNSKVIRRSAGVLSKLKSYKNFSIISCCHCRQRDPICFLISFPITYSYFVIFIRKQILNYYPIFDLSKITIPSRTNKFRFIC